MRASVLSIESYDVPDLESWRPRGDDWSLGVTVLAGPYGEPGEESFDITVCGPGWIANQARAERIIMGRHTLIMDGFDFAVLTRFITDWVAQCTGESWSDVAEKVARLGQWEFEDYKE